jgi:hypothetical protein
MAAKLDVVGVSEGPRGISVARGREPLHETDRQQAAPTTSWYS